MTTMHTVASNKLTGKERELAPRYYYKVSEKTSIVQRLRGAIQIFLTFLFTQVGVIMLIGAYMVGGAFLFCELEQDSLQDQAIIAENVNNQLTLLSLQFLYFRQFKTTLFTFGSSQMSITFFSPDNGETRCPISSWSIRRMWCSTSRMAMLETCPESKCGLCPVQ